MSERYWFVRAIEAQSGGYDANERPCTLTPGMRGRMLRAAAEAQARAGGVDMLSPGGVDVLSAPAPEAPQVPEGHKRRTPKATPAPADPFAH